MTAEERLRELLRSEATTIVPAGDGLAKIRERVERRRRLRVWLVPSAVLATVGAAAAIFLIVPDDARRTQTLQPGTPSPAVNGTPNPSASAGRPTPVRADDGGYPLDVPAIWPFATQSAAASWSASYPWAQDGLEVGRHFVADYLGLTEVNVAQPCVSCGVLALDVNGRSVGQLTLARVGVGFASGHGTQVYTVVSAQGTDLSITTPKPGTAVSSPTSVTGRITGVDENVQLRLLTTAGDELATAGAPAGSAVPWSATLGWSRTDWSTGAITGVTHDGRGILNRVVAIPVTRQTLAATATFAGLVDGHVSLFDSSSGKAVRQLTYPPSGKTDTAASWSAGTLAWVRTAGASACADELDRIDGDKATTVIKAGTVRLSTPQLSPSAAWLAHVEVPCNGSTTHIVVSGGGAPDRRLAVPAGTEAMVRDVRDDGALVVWTASGATHPGRLLAVPAGALSLADAHQVTAVSGCEIGAAGSWYVQQVVVFETCADGSGRLVRFDDSGRRLTADASVQKLEPPDQLAVRDGKVLVWLFGGDSYGRIARYESGAFTTIIANTGCSTTGDLKGCVSGPDW